MSEFLTIGEPIALFASEDMDKSLKDAVHFHKFLAGAEVNVAVGVSRLGHSAQYITRLGEDPFGDFIKDQLAENQIGTDYISSTPDYWTAFQLKDRVSHGDPSIFYFRRNSAAAHFEKRMLDKIDFSGVKFAHLSGIFPAISDQALDAFKYLIQLLHEHNIRTTFDPNLRPQLWSSQEKMAGTLNELAKEAEIILPGDNEGKILVGSDDPKAIADFYLGQSDRTQTVVVKTGAKGAYVQTKAGDSYTVPGFKVDQVVDTVGAGDGFALGLVTALMEGQSLRDAVIRANAVGAFAVQAPGDNDGYPTPEKLAAFLAANPR
ncbi:sugar kinase [Schleiferilactobacillus shenzhenensis]|uniref:KdgK n=1 Tax=Schleiferilactobacillus shenzhenensis LY-73 TaxID=1231336 RepID=U4TLH2_9LACO|nr:sugar kinase [Schleiferilactobacillus shenzhenensis]ERL65049.1 KdgK [Schleiferilactobacillus shenzhenensis LY-73]